MSLQDPVSDMLTRIRNAQAVAKKEVTIPLSKTKLNIVDVLKNEGFIADYKTIKGEGNPEIKIVVTLKYHEGRPVITELRRVSRPGLQVYKTKNEIPQIKSGLGIVIVSTSKGVMTDREARRLGLGGEILCYVS